MCELTLVKLSVWFNFTVYSCESTYNFPFTQIQIVFKPQVVLATSSVDDNTWVGARWCSFFPSNLMAADWKCQQISTVSTQHCYTFLMSNLNLSLLHVQCQASTFFSSSPVSHALSQGSWWGATESRLSKLTAEDWNCTDGHCGRPTSLVVLTQQRDEFWRHWTTHRPWPEPWGWS